MMMMMMMYVCMFSMYVFNDYDGTVCIDVMHTSVHHLNHPQVA